VSNASLGKPRSGRPGRVCLVRPWPQAANLLHPLRRHRTVLRPYLREKVRQRVPAKLTADCLVHICRHATAPDPFASLANTSASRVIDTLETLIDESYFK